LIARSALRLLKIVRAVAYALALLRDSSLRSSKEKQEPKMTHHIGYIHGSKLEPFSPPNFCRSGAGLEEYLYYQKGYRQITGRLYTPE
jgi:hypothetical protein